MEQSVVQKQAIAIKHGPHKSQAKGTQTEAGQGVPEPSLRPVKQVGLAVAQF
jgi:hypothetical protein